MSSIYDWVSLAIFAGLVVLFLQRATGDRAEQDVSLFYYLGAAAGCAAGDYLRLLERAGAAGSHPDAPEPAGRDLADKDHSADSGTDTGPSSGDSIEREA